jgi:hypothetical protein
VFVAWPQGSGPVWARRIAQLIYELPERDEIFKWAFEKYPDADNIHSGDSDEATWEIRDQMLGAAEEHGFDIDGLNECEKDALLEELGEAIYAGLT